MGIRYQAENGKAGDISMQKYSVWQNAWKEEYREPVQITFPDEWTVTSHHMPGDSLPGLTVEELKERIRNPYHSRTIREMAENGHEAVIVFDDISRATPCREIAHIVLEELFAGGIGKDHIRFICALGTHGANSRDDFVKKLGEDIVAEYPVFNHSPFFNCTQIGTNSEGYPVLINSEFWKCDVKIGIGGVSPHHLNGYGGGGKLLFPGVAGFETSVKHHLLGGAAGIGSIESSRFRDGIIENSRLVPDFFKIDTVLNASLQIIGLFAGYFEDSYRHAIRFSAWANSMQLEEPKDIVVVNCNAKGNEAHVSVGNAERELKDGGDLVVINFCPKGMVVHYSAGTFGKDSGAPRWKPFAERAKQKHGRLIYWSPYPEYTAKYNFSDPDKVVYATTWEQVLNLLAGHGSGTTVSIIPDGTISYFGSAVRPVEL